MIDLSRLEKPKQSNGKLIAACPACRAEGGDKSGNHLVIFPSESGFENGKFTCVRHEGNSDHRKAIFSYIGIIDNPSPLDEQARKQYALKKRAQERKQKEQALLTEAIQQRLEKILAPYVSENWRLDLFELSPMHLDCIDAMPHDFIKCLFPMDAILWLGKDERDSGSVQNRANFKPAREWVKLETLPPRIAPAHFKSNSFQRTSENILERPFLIMECDEIIGKKPETDAEKERNKQLTAALALYAVDKLGLNLRAVIDTGNKSLHLWFDRPPEDAVKAIREMIYGLRIDDTPFDHSNIPLRMPHCIHSPEIQIPAKLLYLKPFYI